MELNERIKYLRQKKGLRQSDIASLIGIDRVSYVNWEKRGKGLTIEQLWQIAKSLEITPKELLFDEKPNDNERETENLKKELEMTKEQLELIKGTFSATESLLSTLLFIKEEKEKIEFELKMELQFYTFLFIKYAVIPEKEFAPFLELNDNDERQAKIHFLNNYKDKNKIEESRLMEFMKRWKDIEKKDKKDKEE